MSTYNHLLQPIKINSLEAANRIVMPPMATNFADEEGRVTDANVAYYEERARGGVGYITIEHTGIRPDGRAFARMLMIHTDDHIPGFRRLIGAIHEAGGKVVVQINHAGRQTTSPVTGHTPVAPSAIPCPIRQEVPKELTVPEIEDLVRDFARAAGRVKEAGADGVELHMAHGYLLNQFLSPIVNKRDDEYGGDPTRRMRAPLEVLRSVRETVGPDFPIVCRFSADEYMEGGLRLADSQVIAKALEENGADAIHVSACQSSSPFPLIPHYYIEEGVFVPLAEGIKAVVNIPVITVGRIRTPELAERIVAEGRADLVSMGRALIADPYLPLKVREGRRDDIAPCISCSNCSLSLAKIGSLRCAVNPEVSREGRLKAAGRAEAPKKVWIIGGGPAGLKAAQVAALQGHDVSLFEKDKELGGRFRLAALPPGKSILQEFTAYLIRQVEGLGVKVLTGQPFEPDLLDRESPDELILATGARSCVPEFCCGADVVTDEQVFAGEVPVGRRVLVLGGGGIGTELADMLAGEGKEVTIVEMREDVALDLHPAIRSFLKNRLAERGVEVLTSTKVRSLTDGVLQAEGPSGGIERTGYETIVSSLGSQSNLELADNLKSKVGRLHVIGDAKDPRHVMEAVLEAEETILGL